MSKKRKSYIPCKILPKDDWFPFTCTSGEEWSDGNIDHDLPNIDITCTIKMYEERAGYCDNTLNSTICKENDGPTVDARNDSEVDSEVKTFENIPPLKSQSENTNRLSQNASDLDPISSNLEQTSPYIISNANIQMSKKRKYEDTQITGSATEQSFQDVTLDKTSQLSTPEKFAVEDSSVGIIDIEDSVSDYGDSESGQEINFPFVPDFVSTDDDLLNTWKKRLCGLKFIENSLDSVKMQVKDDKGRLRYFRWILHEMQHCDYISDLQETPADTDVETLLNGTYLLPVGIEDGTVNIVKQQWKDTCKGTSQQVVGRMIIIQQCLLPAFDLLDIEHGKLSSHLLLQHLHAALLPMCSYFIIKGSFKRNNIDYKFPCIKTHYGRKCSMIAEEAAHFLCHWMPLLRLQFSSSLKPPLSQIQQVFTQYMANIGFIKAYLPMEIWQKCRSFKVKKEIIRDQFDRLLTAISAFQGSSGGILRQTSIEQKDHLSNSSLKEAPLVEKTPPVVQQDDTVDIHTTFENMISLINSDSSSDQSSYAKPDKNVYDRTAELKDYVSISEEKRENTFNQDNVEEKKPKLIPSSGLGMKLKVSNCTDPVCPFWDNHHSRKDENFLPENIKQDLQANHNEKQSVAQIHSIVSRKTSLDILSKSIQKVISKEEVNSMTAEKQFNIPRLSRPNVDVTFEYTENAYKRKKSENIQSRNNNSVATPISWPVKPGMIQRASANPRMNTQGTPVPSGHLPKLVQIPQNTYFDPAMNMPNPESTLMRRASRISHIPHRSGVSGSLPGTIASWHSPPYLYGDKKQHSRSHSCDSHDSRNKTYKVPAKRLRFSLPETEIGNNQVMFEIKKSEARSKSIARFPEKSSNARECKPQNLANAFKEAVKEDAVNSAESFLDTAEKLIKAAKSSHGTSEMKRVKEPDRWAPKSVFENMPEQKVEHNSQRIRTLSSQKSPFISQSGNRIVSQQPTYSRSSSILLEGGRSKSKSGNRKRPEGHVDSRMYQWKTNVPNRICAKTTGHLYGDVQVGNIVASRRTSSSDEKGEYDVHAGTVVGVQRTGSVQQKKLDTFGIKKTESRFYPKGLDAPNLTQGSVLKERNMKGVKFQMKGLNEKRQTYIQAGQTPVMKVHDRLPKPQENFQRLAIKERRNKEKYFSRESKDDEVNMDELTKMVRTVSQRAFEGAMQTVARSINNMEGELHTARQKMLEARKRRQQLQRQVNAIKHNSTQHGV